MLTDDLSQTDREYPIQGLSGGFYSVFEEVMNLIFGCTMGYLGCMMNLHFFFGFLLVCQLRFLYRQLKKPVHFPKGSAATKSIGRARIGFRNRLISSITCAALGQVLPGGGATGVKSWKKKGWLFPSILMVHPSPATSWSSLSGKMSTQLLNPDPKIRAKRCQNCVVFLCGPGLM